MIEVLDRLRTQPDVSHGSELVERDGLAETRAGQILHRSLISPWDAIEQRDDVARLWIGVVDRLKKQRPRQRSLLQMSALRQLRQLGVVLRVKCYVHTQGSVHAFNVLHGSTRSVYSVFAEAVNTAGPRTAARMRRQPGCSAAGIAGA